MSFLLRRLLRVSSFASCTINLSAAGWTLGGNSCRRTTLSLQPRRKQPCRWMSMTGGDERGNSIGDDDLSHVMRDSYKETSGNQYSAHQGCQDMLLGCAKRLKERGHQNNNPSSATTQWKIADLGSADGSNSIRTIEIFLDALNRDGEPNNAKEVLLAIRTFTLSSRNIHQATKPSSPRPLPLGLRRRPDKAKAKVKTKSLMTS